VLHVWYVDSRAVSEHAVRWTRESLQVVKMYKKKFASKSVKKKSSDVLYLADIFEKKKRKRDFQLSNQ
jgi:hypothetical protein